jgi:hypothetical protein
MKNLSLLALGLVVGVALAAGAGTIIAQTSSTSTMPCIDPNATSTLPMSPMSNGNLSVVSVSIPKNNLTLGDTSTTLSANLISQGGGNANNVTVHVQLLNQMVD